MASKNPIPTPHITAKAGDYAETVLMPGDPLRARFIAETYLENVKQVNAVRGMLGFTGEYEGKRVSVQGSGMGMPSIGIYSYELYHFYGVQNIIRVGSAGGIDESLHIGDIVIGVGACTDSNYASNFNLPGTFAPTASYELIAKAVAAAEAMGVAYRAGNVLSSDVFYGDDETAMRAWQKMGVLAVEMEAAALYMNAARCGKKALCVATISDTIFTGEVTTAEERQISFTKMMELALRVATGE